MKKYLSSFRIWDHWDKLLEMFWNNNKVAYICSALDHCKKEERDSYMQNDLDSLNSLWLNAEALDLRDFFWKSNNLCKKIKDYDWVFVSWWNTFILAQAYKLSWFWKLMQEYEIQGHNFVYAWYSAWVCILSPSLKWLDIVDDPNIHPYKELQETIWEWLSIIPYTFSPHYDSDHPESADIEKEIQYCIDNKILFKALRDWEVLIE